MTTPEQKILPDTPVGDVDISHVKDILDEQNLKYHLEPAPSPEDGSQPAGGDVLRTGFSNTAMAMQIRNGILVVDSIWRGQVPTTEGPQVLKTTNQWNSQHFAPTLRFFETGQETLAISAVREMDVATGASRNQLGAFLMSTINAVLESFAFIEQTFPELVTWQEPHND